MSDLDEKQTTALMKLGSIMKKAVVVSENRLLHVRLRTVEIGGLVVLVILCLIIWRLAGEVKRERVRTTEEIAWIKDGFRLNDLGPHERKEKYRKVALRIFAEYSYRYDRRDIKCMIKEQKLRIIDLNYEYAEMLNFGYYDIFCFGVLETSLNPNSIGDYGEWGWLQQKMPTARFAERMLQLMPPRFRRKLEFRLTEEEDLLDPETALKVAYVLLYYFRRDFRGRDEWWVSIYHWGGFLSRYWRKGEGSIPVEFTINDIKYEVYKYYASWKILQAVFEAGNVRAGKPVVIKWAKVQNKLLREEVQLYKAQKIIRGLRNANDKKDRMIKELTAHDKKMKKMFTRAERDLRSIFGIAKQGKVAKLQANLRKAKGPVKKLLKNIEKNDKTKFILIITGSCLALLTILAGFGYGTFRFVQYVIRRWRKI